MLRQIEWWLQNRPTTKNGVFPVTNLFCSKFWFSLRASYKELLCCTYNPNAHICTFCKRWSFIWRCFFPMSILKPYFMLLKFLAIYFLLKVWEILRLFTLKLILSRWKSLRHIVFEVNLFIFFFHWIYLKDTMYDWTVVILNNQWGNEPAFS